jgi:hypothetical protein
MIYSRNGKPTGRAIVSLRDIMAAPGKVGRARDHLIFRAIMIQMRSIMD